MLRFFLDLLYPPKCISCSASGSDWWCASCRSTVERLPYDPCAKCLATDVGHDVSSCPGLLPFAGVVATGFYHSLPLRRLIAGLKYDGVTAAAPSMDAYLKDIIASRPAPFPWASESSLLVFPMPLSDARERERGFNQAAWIAERLCHTLDRRGALQCAPTTAPLLIRRKSSTAQAELAHDPALRSANIKGQFQAVRRLTEPVLLVDDVVTTGSTAAESARALLSAGAPRVYLFALAVGK